MNKLKCGGCVHYAAHQVGQRDGTKRDARTGNCLKQTLYPYAKGRVYPPGAQVAAEGEVVTPAQIRVVNATDVVVGCAHAAPKGAP